MPSDYRILAGLSAGEFPRSSNTTHVSLLPATEPDNPYFLRRGFQAFIAIENCSYAYLLREDDQCKW